MTLINTTKQNTELIYRLKGLDMAGAVLHVGVHPDDEDVGLMAYMARKLGVRIIYWSATRGEGGENRIGPYEEETLGVYRTWESLEARAVDGGEALFGPFYDYGYSKFGDEALNKWGRENLVREIVRAIRLVQPQVVIARWSGQPKDGHGHHVAIGQVTPEAFETAGDPDRFPELTAQGLPPWQPRKLYQSTMGDWAPGEDVSFGQIIPEYEEAGLVRLNTGQFDPAAGLTYQEQAWVGFNSHKTQAMGFAPEEGDFYYYYKLSKSLVPVSEPENDLFDGLDPSLTGLADYAGEDRAALRQKLRLIKDDVKMALEQFRVYEPMDAAEFLLHGLALLKSLAADLGHEQPPDPLALALARKIVDFEAVIGQCLGLRLECLADNARVIPGQQFTISTHLWNHYYGQLDQASFALRLPAGWQTRQLESSPSRRAGTNNEATYQVTIAETTKLATPYWLVKPRQPYAYDWSGSPADGLPFGPPQVAVECQVTLGKHRLTLHEPAVLREAFVGGFRELPVVVVPPISLHPRTKQEFLHCSPEQQQLEFQLVVRSNAPHGGVQGELRVETPAGWTVEPKETPLSLGPAGDARTLRLTLTIPGQAPAGQYPLRYIVHCQGRDYDVVLEPVRMVAPGLPGMPDESNCIKEEFVTVPAVVNVHLIEVKFVYGLKYAYIKGSAEEILGSLRHFGLDFQLISDDELGYVDLDRFDAVVVGPDAYLVRDGLVKNAARFLKYVEEGGTLIVLRQGFAYERPGLAPYPLRYSQPNDEVTFEDAPVTRLADHSLLKLPNAIGDEDFAGWVKDRGNFFLGQWDPHYRPILACNDPGEAPKQGGLVMANYGQGIYIYCAYSLFRQLPAGVPGAFRLFANILAQPMARILEWAALLKHISIFTFMSEEQLQAVAGIMSERWELEGAYLCRQGETGDEMYIILDGQVEIIVETEGHEQLVARRGPGDIIGEMAVLSSKPRMASMRTGTEVHMLSLAGEQFRTLAHQHPEMLDQIILMLVDKLASSGVE